MDLLNERITVKAGGLALLAAMLWGGNAVTIKMALGGVPPFALAGIRFLIGGLTILAWAVLNRVALSMKAGEHRGLFSLALLFAMQILLLNQGTDFTLASRAAILISTYPFFVALFAHLFIPGERIRRRQVLGMLLSFSGIVIVFAEGLKLGETRYLAGDAMILTSALLLGARQVYVKHISQRTHPYRLLLWQAALSLPVFLLLTVTLERGSMYRIDPTVAVAILYQGIVVAGFCFIVWVSLLRRYSPSRLGVFAFCTPVFGVLLSNMLLGDRLTFWVLGSMILVGAGIAIVNLDS